ncbi:MAG: hypothetical protein ACR2GC_01400 [Methyloceanibacter sp.]|uniref:hypothetical protein n=1 Tax=Methyloceanibacter sp. TaxID=1965321 RepID=UPI003D9B9B57
MAGFLEEELLAREAKTLGLDQNDTIVRRRLAQKLAFLVNDTSRVAEPNDEELRQFYNKNADRFRVEARLSFTQVFFNPERRQHAETDAKAALMSISTGGGGDRAKLIGDPTLLEGGEPQSMTPAAVRRPHRRPSRAVLSSVARPGN